MWWCASSYGLTFNTVYTAPQTPMEIFMSNEQPLRLHKYTRTMYWTWCVCVWLLFAGNRQTNNNESETNDNSISLCIYLYIYKAQQLAVPLLSFVELFKALAHIKFTAVSHSSVEFFFWNRTLFSGMYIMKLILFLSHCGHWLYLEVIYKVKNFPFVFKSQVYPSYLLLIFFRFIFFLSLSGIHTQAFVYVYRIIYTNCY